MISVMEVARGQLMQGPLTEEQKAAVWDWAGRVGRLAEWPDISGERRQRSDCTFERPVGFVRDEHLRTEEREEISRGLTAHESYRCIATRLDRAPSTIS